MTNFSQTYNYLNKLYSLITATAADIITTLMAESKPTNAKQAAPGGSKFKKFLDGSTHTDSKPLVGHLSRVVEVMAKQHRDDPVKAFEDVSVYVSRGETADAGKPAADDDSGDDADLGYLRDEPEQIQAYLKKTAEFMVDCRGDF